MARSDDRRCSTSPGRRSASASGRDWLEMTALLLVGLMPFAALGIAASATCSRPTRSARRSAARPRCSRSSAASGSRSRAARCTTSRRRCPRTGSSRRATSALGGDGWGVTGWLVVIGLDVGAGAAGHAGLPARHGERPRDELVPIRHDCAVTNDLDMWDRRPGPSRAARVVLGLLFLIGPISDLATGSRAGAPAALSLGLAAFVGLLAACCRRCPRSPGGARDARAAGLGLLALLAVGPLALGGAPRRSSPSSSTSSPPCRSCSSPCVRRCS